MARVLGGCSSSFDLDNETADNEIITADISHVHALEGKSGSKAINIVGSISSAKVNVLIHTGSSHDFLHPQIAERMCLPLSTVKPFRVYVGNGASLLCTHASLQTKLDLQGTMFLVDLHILPVHEPDVILGMEWLESLGKVTHDYPNKTMELYCGDKMVRLQGSAPLPRRISLHSLATLLSYSTSHELYEIVPVHAEMGLDASGNAATFPAATSTIVREVLDRHSPVFSLPEGMPPPDSLITESICSPT